MPPNATPAGEGASTPPDPAVELVLYVSPTSAASFRARATLEDILRSWPAASVRYEVCDVSRQALRAEEDRVVFVPTLVKRRPEPRAWFVGDLRDPAVVSALPLACGLGRIG